MRHILILLVLSGPTANPGPDTNPALTTVEFSSLERCEAAREAILEEATDEEAEDPLFRFRFIPHAVCVRR